jgi:hypothetical protein
MMTGRPCSTGLGPPKSSGAVTKDRRPTLQTVATAVGVSQAAVSEVLNDRADVSAATWHWCSGYSCSTSTCTWATHRQPGRRGTPINRPGLHRHGEPVLRRDPPRGHVEPRGCHGVVDAEPYRLAPVFQRIRLRRTVRRHHRRFRTHRLWINGILDHAHVVSRRWVGASQRRAVDDDREAPAPRPPGRSCHGTHRPFLDGRPPTNVWIRTVGVCHEGARNRTGVPADLGGDQGGAVRMPLA